MNFKSDNMCGVSDKIMAALSAANHGVQNSYGADEYSLKMQARFAEIFEKDVTVFLTCTGAAANSLALSSLVRPYELIACHQDAHINADEGGAPVFFTGGANLLLIEGQNGKISPDCLVSQLDRAVALKPRRQKPGCLSVTQATECGTVYSIDELQVIVDIARRFQLPVHMDGARFVNSLVSLNRTPAEATWKAGVDVMSFGGTKNGCLNAEAIVFFNKKYAHNFEYLHKRSGQAMSKTRFFAAQFLAYFEDDLWLGNGKTANRMALMLEMVFKNAGIKVVYPVEGNEVFCQMDPDLVARMMRSGCAFYPWGLPEQQVYRFVTSCFTTEAEINDVKTCLHGV